MDGLMLYEELNERNSSWEPRLHKTSSIINQLYGLYFIWSCLYLNELELVKKKGRRRKVINSRRNINK